MVCVILPDKRKKTLKKKNISISLNVVNDRYLGNTLK